jgi:molybdopterin-guanine dinucleotide biosynthesis protein A
MTTPINGLVLAGGKSVRMGKDKSSIDWHGKEQQYYLADLLESFCAEVFISRREEVQNEKDLHYKILVDSYTGIGPYGAILSAFRFQPDFAWLVVACDLPLIDKNILSYLLENRDETKIATTFKSPFDGLPEPLITIWEPKSYEVLLSNLSNGYTCPRKVLIKSDDVHILQPPDANSLINVNTPEDLAKAEQLFLTKQQLPHAK